MTGGGRGRGNGKGGESGNKDDDKGKGNDNDCDRDSSSSSNTPSYKGIKALLRRAAERGAAGQRHALRINVVVNKLLSGETTIISP